MSSFSLLIANPNIKTQQKKVIKNGIDIAIVLDLSLSMEADDIKPNRIEVAKQVISDFTSNSPMMRFDMIDEAYTSMNELLQIKSFHQILD